MFRSLARNVVLNKRSLPRTALIVSRVLSSPSTSTNPSSTSPPPHIPSPNRKQKLDLRPRPSTLSSTHLPRKPIEPIIPSFSSPNIRTVKETTKRDIEDAEAHGILTPPPPHANWFGKTLHKGIQLAARFPLTVCRFSHTLSRNSITGA